jgi:hypothetical protein
VPGLFLSSDIYRYAWDGVVQHAGISPYRYAPGDPALSFLRAPNQDLFNHINRREYAQTIYPPAAQIIFYLVTWISSTVRFMKLAMVLFEGMIVWALDWNVARDGPAAGADSLVRVVSYAGLGDRRGGTPGLGRDGVYFACAAGAFTTPGRF